MADFDTSELTALATLTHIYGVSATWVLPGHGPPWNSGVAEALRRVREAAAS